MKVGLITTGFPRFEGDHAGAFLLTLARRIVAQGHEVRVLAPEPAGRRSPPRFSGIEMRWVAYARPRGLQCTFYEHGAPENLRLHPLRVAGAMTFTVALVRAARTELGDCDALVSSWCLPSGWAGSVVAEGRPHLAICHETDVRWLAKMPVRRPVARRIAAGASSMWFLSARHRDRFLDIAKLSAGAIQSHVGPMPVEPPEELPQSRFELRRELGIDGFCLLFLGRLVPVKGVDDLLVAAAASSRPLEIRIAGDGPERSRLESLARSLGLCVTFEGWVRGPRKEALFRACDALVVPSKDTDGLPTVLFEARARALPIIATRAGAIGDHFRPSPETHLVAADDPVALSRAIEELARRSAVRA